MSKGFCALLRDIPYMVDIDSAVEAARRRGARRVVLQLPEGMLQYGLYIAKCMEEMLEGAASVYLHADPTYGACDLHYGELDTTVKPDLIVHVGHSPYPAELAHEALEPRGRVVYVRALSKAELPLDALREAASILAGRYSVRRVGIATTAQHTHIARKAAEVLRGEGLEVAVPPGLRPYFGEAQVLGCDYRLARSVRAEGFIYVGGGVFHPLGLYLATLKPVVQVDPYRGASEDLTLQGEKLYRSRLYKVSQSIGARRWGVIVGLKTGQYRPWLVEKLARAIESAGGEYLLIASEVTTLSQLVAIDNSWFEAFTVTSCPRLPTDDFWSYEKPVLTPGEAIMALEGRLEPYRFPW
ncbi:diphthamide biosynthesis enzyme Dph2 [Aeropyrum camini]|uniref:2-(3-amino-3-carboxypropyl)histidine synthase n=2 Tax=Aeropyrum camini TaxID=229980 RepID=U3TBJ8_9CREN|nr:diphthamide biosynthesis enzyme Dph2 [Aeropyrum camini]BAN89796.1 diphthamide synthase subunit DPH2 [Aeropyrum camini SY1 = JCM 12091]